MQLRGDSDAAVGSTHESDEFVLQLVVQTSDHHFHSVSNLSDPLVLCTPDGLHVSLLKRDITHTRWTTTSLQQWQARQRHLVDAIAPTLQSSI